MSSLYRSESTTYANAVKDAYSPAKTKAIRSQSELDLQAVISCHRTHPADGHYTYADEVMDRERSARIRAEASDARRAPPPGDVWTAHTTGTFYKPIYTKNNLYGNRRYYSRYDDGKDADYFDWDLDHAVSRVKEERAITERFATPRRAPTYWEHQLFKDGSLLRGQKMISPYMFSDKYQSSSFLSSALRTPSYWTLRYERMR